MAGQFRISQLARCPGNDELTGKAARGGHVTTRTPSIEERPDDGNDASQRPFLSLYRRAERSKHVDVRPKPLGEQI